MTLFQRTVEGTLPSSFYEATIILIPKLDKKKSKLQASITDEYKFKIPQGNTNKPSPTTH